MAKLGVLKSVGHNLADSVASGVGLMIGYYQMDVYGEAAISPERFIEIDFLTGNIRGKISQSLADGLELYKREFPSLCARHGVETSDFRELILRFTVKNNFELGITVIVANQQGRRSTDEYQGTPAARVRIVDHLGRIRSL